MKRTGTPLEELRPLVVYPPEAVLRIEHVAAALGVSVATVERSDLPCFYLGVSQARCRRYVWGVVLEVLKKRSQ